MSSHHSNIAKDMTAHKKHKQQILAFQGANGARQDYHTHRVHSRSDSRYVNQTIGGKLVHKDEDQDHGIKRWTQKPSPARECEKIRRTG